MRSLEEVRPALARSVPTAWINLEVLAFYSIEAYTASLCCCSQNSLTVLNSCTTPLVAIIASSLSWSSSSAVGMCLPINLIFSFSCFFFFKSASLFCSSVTSLEGRLYLARMGSADLEGSIFLLMIDWKAAAKEDLRTPLFFLLMPCDLSYCSWSKSAPMLSCCLIVRRSSAPASLSLSSESYFLALFLRRPRTVFFFSSLKLENSTVPSGACSCEGSSLTFWCDF
ncbi:hypothetical protein FGO68_gene1210 [Halteria grandinella]|uniref:Uncharacterized protein n=1 Tax=Halteria grandinella TaxID=5974 RepID=A0A8J8NQQ8_HALGN|nr:hypothetical protein FGO68_gene1210 [Halteria grandinella]